MEPEPGIPFVVEPEVNPGKQLSITRGMLSGKHVLTLIWMIMTGGSFKIVSNWAVLTQHTTVNMEDSCLDCSKG